MLEVAVRQYDYGIAYIVRSAWDIRICNDIPYQIYEFENSIPARRIKTKRKTNRSDRILFFFLLFVAHVNKVIGILQKRMWWKI